MDYEYWASRTDADLAERDIAEFNLVCASGLPPTGDIDVDAIRRDLDERAEVIESATARAVRMRGNDPDYDGLSDSHFRIVCLGSMLRKMGVKMNYAIVEREEFDATDCRDYFIHSIFSDHLTSCVPMAVIFIAIGRRLGYPIKLVHATRHMFGRWEGTDGERFNFEPTTFGQHSYSDDYYRTWPFPRPRSEQHLTRFLTSLSPREELGHFICQRARTLMDNLMVDEAMIAAHWCSKIVPHDPSYEEDWAGITISWMAMPEIKKKKLTEPLDVVSCIPPAKKPWQGKACYRARNDLERIFRNRQRKNGEYHDAVAYEERMSKLETYLTTRIDVCSMPRKPKR
jgi:hypothetical protein